MQEPLRTGGGTGIEATLQLFVEMGYQSEPGQSTWADELS